MLLLALLLLFFLWTSLHTSTTLLKACYQYPAIISVIGLSTEVSVLLLTFLTLEKYICIVYPFRCLRPGKCRTITVLILIWIIGVIVAFIPLSNKEFFKNYYGTNGVCFPLHSEDAESTGAQIYSVAIFLGKKFCIKSLFKDLTV